MPTNQRQLLLLKAGIRWGYNQEERWKFHKQNIWTSRSSSQTYEAGDAVLLLQQRTGHLSDEQVGPSRPCSCRNQTQLKCGVRMSHLSERVLNNYLQTNLLFCCFVFLLGLCAYTKPNQTSPIISPARLCHFLFPFPFKIVVFFFLENQPGQEKPTENALWASPNKLSLSSGSPTSEDYFRSSLSHLETFQALF